MQSFPNTDVQVLELRAEPNDRRIAEVGWDRAALGTIIRSLGDGAWLGEYFDGQARLPVILRTNLEERPEDLAQAPLITPSGEVVPLGELVTLRTTLVPEQIRRVDHHRTVTLTVDPPPTLSLEDMLAKISNEIVPTLRADLPADANIRLAGSADRLDTIIQTMSGNFLLALLVPLALLSSVKPQMELPIKVANKQMSATVRTVVPVGEERSRQFELRMILADSAFNVGSALEVGLPERDAADALVVPRDAIAVRQTGNYLMRIRRDNTAERVAITSLATDGDLVTIDGPVNAGDVVVIRGVERLQHGQRVTILARDAALQTDPNPDA